MVKYNLLTELRKNQYSPLQNNPIKLPNCSGVYVICIKNKDNLPKDMYGLEYKDLDNLAVIYVGSSKRSLRSRDYRCHFLGTARNSTFRKSLGVLFVLRKEFLEKGKYKFTRDDETG